MGIRFSISQKVITHLIQSSGDPSLKIAKCQKYLDPDAGLSVSMRNFNLIHSDLSASVQPLNSNLLAFFLWACEASSTTSKSQKIYTAKEVMNLGGIQAYPLDVFNLVMPQFLIFLNVCSSRIRPSLSRIF
jgi:hypothetical protein